MDNSSNAGSQSLPLDAVLTLFDDQEHGITLDNYLALPPDERPLLLGYDRKDRIPGPTSLEAADQNESLGVLSVVFASQHVLVAPPEMKVITDDGLVRLADLSVPSGHRARVKVGSHLLPFYYVRTQALPAVSCRRVMANRSVPAVVVNGVAVEPTL